MIDIFPQEIGTYITRNDRVFRAHHIWQEKPEVVKNIKIIEKFFGLSQAFFLAQSHSSDIVIVTQEKLGEILFADACITKLTNVSLNVVVADCVPIILYDRKNKIIAAIHAGWKGSSQRILTKTLHTMQSEFESIPEDIFIYFGPSICQNCYEVGEEVAKIFDKKFLNSSQSPGKYLLDVKAVNISEALNFGVSRENLEISHECTFELPEKYFSFRRDGKKGNFVVGIYIK